MGRASGRKNLPRAVQPGTPAGDEIGESARQDPAGSPIPGLTGNIVNYETVRREPPVGEPLPEFRGMMAHGVPPSENTTEERAQLERDGALAQHRPPTRPDLSGPRPKPPAIPVYLVEVGGGGTPITTLAGQKISVPAQGSAAARVAARDETRSDFYIQAETVSGSTSTAQALIATGGGTGTATLPVGSSITGADITIGTPTASGQTTVTVTGAAGGTLTYYLTGEGTATEALPLRFPAPLAPAVAGTAIAVTAVAGATEGPVSIIAYGATTAPLGIRVSHEVGDLDVGLGALIRPGAYQKLDNFQDELFAVSADSNPQVVSVLYLFEIPAGA
jgi:hypothetical protein